MRTQSATFPLYPRTLALGSPCISLWRRVPDALQYLSPLNCISSWYFGSDNNKKWKLSRKIGVDLSSFEHVSIKHHPQVTVSAAYLGSQLVTEMRWWDDGSLFLHRPLAPLLDQRRPRVTSRLLAGLVLHWHCPIYLVIHSSAQRPLYWANVKLSITDFAPKNKICSHASPRTLQLPTHASQCQESRH